MYRRLTIEEIKTRRSKYHQIPAFMVTYRAMDWLSSKYRDIDPVEAWDEAVETMKTLAAEEYKRFAIETTCRDLPRKYLEFQNVDGSIQMRSKEESKRTALMVLLNVVFMLIMRQKELDDHPYKDFCDWIIPTLQDLPHYYYMCKMIRTNEVNLEDEVGCELEPTDFLNPEGMPMPIREGDITQKNLQRAITTTLQCEKYFQKGIGAEYIIALWNEMLNDQYLHLDKLLNGQSFPTLVCGVIGILSEQIFIKCTYNDLAEEMTISGIDKKDTIAKYIGLKCSGSGNLRKVATYLKNRAGKSSRKSSDFDLE